MMVKPKILRVWGKADSFDIEFTYEGGTRWKCSVPPDTKDGQYAAEIWAVNEFGELAYWTGELFMVNGVCCLRFDDSSYRIWLKTAATSIGKLTAQRREVRLRANAFTVRLLPETTITGRKGCAHVSK